MSLNALEFLRAVLPDNGLYISWTKTINSRRSYNTVFSSVEALCNFILDQDAKGLTVYHACSAYADARGVWNARKNKFEVRCQANVRAVRSLWMDIDGGQDAVTKGSGYASTVEAAHAVVAFCQAHSLPLPLYVSSGSGLHVYWPLVETLNPDDWFRYASGLKRAAQQWGLKHDPARTSDSASVLRTPGTVNRKRGSELVSSGPASGPFPLQLFSNLALASGVASSASSMPARNNAAPVSALSAALLAYDGPPASAETIAHHCAHVRAFRDTRGNLPEPLWYAALGVLAFCTDGAALAHQWSSGYPRYSPDETAGKFERAKQLTGATTCAKFESLDHGKCAACPHRGQIKSPISLGTAPGIAASDTVTTSTTSSGLASSVSALPTATTGFGRVESGPRLLSGVQLPPLRAPYRWSLKNQLVMEMAHDGKDIELLISEYPIFLEGVQTGELNTTRFSYHFKQYLPLQGWIDIHVSAEELLGPGGIGKLFGRGAVIHEPKAFMHYVHMAVDTFNKERKLRMRYEQFGWKEGGNAFLCGQRLYRAGAVETVLGTDEVRTRAQFLEPAKTGSLEDWSNAANSLFQLGCEAQSFALLCAFAAVFTPLHSANEGGAIVHLVSGASGTGKTTTLAGVSSVWGHSRGLQITNIDTAVAKSITLGTLGNLPAVYDEMWARDPEVVREFVMTFTNGRDKLRGTRDGEVKHVMASWQTLLVSAANLSLVELLNSTAGVEAPAMRVLEFPLELPPHIQHSQGDRLRKALEANAGHAGDVYLRYLMQDDVRRWALDALQQWTDDIWEETKLRAEHRFWVRTLGSVAVAASLVTQLGILSFQPSRIVEWAIKELTSRKDETERSLPDAHSRVLNEFLAEHINDTLVMQNAHVQGNRSRQLAILKPSRRLLIRYEINPGKIYVQETVFRKWLLNKSVNARELVADLKKQHVLLGMRAITLAAGTDFPGGQARCFEVNALHPLLGGVLTEITELQAVRKPVATALG